MIEHYSSLKAKEILASATTWMNLEHMMLSEMSRSQKVKYSAIPPLGGPWSRRDRKRQEGGGGCMGLEEGEGKGVFDGDRVSVLLTGWKVPETDSDDGCTM